MDINVAKRMKIEHFALNVPEPKAMVEWYAQHLGLNVESRMEEPPYMHFLVDNSGQILIEFYYNDAAPVLEFDQLNALTLHLAFVSDQPSADKDRLLKAGAKEVSDQTLADGSRLVMLKDPWGLAIQLCCRAKPKIARVD